jgi:hypothetical protein
MRCREIITVFYDNCTRHINVFHWHNSEALDVKSGVGRKLSFCTERVRHCGNCTRRVRKGRVHHVWADMENFSCLLWQHCRRP